MTEHLPVPEGASHRLRLRACMRLMEWVAANAQPITSGREMGAADLILLSIFARSTRTYEAIIRHLGEAGFGEQGLMLARSLWEDMVDAHWVTLNEDLAIQRLEQHDLYSRLLRAETQRKYPEMFDGREPPKIKVTNAEHKELRSLFRGGTGSWTGPSKTAQRLKSVLSCWPTEQLQREVLFWQDWVVKMLNEVVHPSGLSIGRIAAPTIDDDETMAFRFGSTSEWLTQALMGAWFTYLQTLALVVSRYAPTMHEQYDEQVHALRRDFHRAHHWDETGTLTEPPPMPED